MFHLREDHFSMFIPKWKVDNDSTIAYKNRFIKSNLISGTNENNLEMDALSESEIRGAYRSM